MRLNVRSVESGREKYEDGSRGRDVKAQRRSRVSRQGRSKDCTSRPTLPCNTCLSNNLIVRHYRTSAVGESPRILDTRNIYAHKPPAGRWRDRSNGPLLIQNAMSSITTVAFRVAPLSHISVGKCDEEVENRTGRARYRPIDGSGSLVPIKHVLGSDRIDNRQLPRCSRNT